MSLTEEQTMIRDTAREFARRRLAPNSAAWEEAGAIPLEIIRELGALGFLGMLVPTEWDGPGADMVSLALAMEEIAAGDGALSTLMSTQNSVGCRPLLIEGTQEQKEKYLRNLARGEIVSAFCLSEPHGGSDALNLKTRATQTGTGWTLNGTKSFVTSGRTADIALVIAVTDADAGKRRLSAFIVPTKTPGFIVNRVEKKMGQNASDTCEIILDNVELAHEALLGQIGDGYRIALSNLEGGRIAIAAQATGLARTALEMAIAYANERVTFGKRIAEHQAVQFRLADMATNVEAARQLYLHAARLRDDGKPCLQEASMAKLFASDMAERVCSDAIQTFGGAGYIQDSGVERIYRAVRVCRIYEGTNDILRMVIGRALTGR